jgi:predicted nuclease of predicted toxin-antitoxin system
MKLKLDENLGPRPAEMLRNAGHDVRTAADQGLCGASDRRLADACVAEQRCLVTLDLGFANPLLFDPARHAGLAVLRVPARVTAAIIESLVETLLVGLERGAVGGRLWVVEPGRIREHDQERS